MQDSSGLPLSSEARKQKLESYLDSRIDRKLLTLSQQLGGQAATTQSALDNLALQMDSIQRELKELRQNQLELHEDYDRYREWGEGVAKTAGSLKGDKRILEKSMERTDDLVELALLSLKVLEPTARALNWVIDRLHRLERRNYSGSDGRDVTKLGVRGPKRRSSDL